MKNSFTFNVHYDGHSDVLYISKGRVAAARTTEDDYGIIWRYDVEGKLISATIMDFYERWSHDEQTLERQIANQFHLPEPQAQLVMNYAKSLLNERH